MRRYLGTLPQMAEISDISRGMSVLSITAEEFNSWKQEHIVFAEVAPPGAMGFAGTIHLYGFKDGALNAYRISILDQEELFWEAATWFEDYSDNNREY